jgi:exopolysaccharide biosynthesis polyprenyl glycosylphosphotransferase
VDQPVGEAEQAAATGAIEVAPDAPARARPLPRVGNRRGLRRHLAQDALRRRMLAVADAAAVLAAATVAELGPLPFPGALTAAALLPVWIVLAKLYGLYDRDHRALRHLTVDELGSLATWATAGTAITLVVTAAGPAGAPDIGGAVQLWIVLVVAAPLLRALVRSLWRAWAAPETALLLGSGPLERATHRKLELFKDIHVRVAGTVDLADLPGGGGELAAAMRAACDGELPEHVIVCSHEIQEAALADVVACCRQRRIKLSMVPPLRGAFGTAVRLSHVADLPVVEYHTGDPSVSTMMLKRCVDVAIAGVALVATAPLLALAALAIKLDSRGPVLYVQQRAGLGGRPFAMLKFRTMVDRAEERLAEVVRIDELADPMFKLRNDPRVTRVGRLLRRWSLDELPQLVNVLRGDMSLVGPRPEQVELVARYRPEHRFRLEARPGMTGPMQVFGRGALDFDERLAVEREYIESLSLARDVRILLMTIPVVISGRGAF